jgi:hypothetical protein
LFDALLPVEPVTLPRAFKQISTASPLLDPEPSMPLDDEALVHACRRLLGTPCDAYPLLPREDPETWRERSLRALYRLASRGSFSAPDALGGRLGDHVEALLRDDLAPGLLHSPGRTRLLGELLRNLERPGRVNQGLKGTCTVTCVETWIAADQPGEYARLVAGLALGEGRVPLRDGSVLVRDEEQLDFSLREGRRSPASRLIQVAFMEYAYPNLDYRNADDAQYEEEGGATPGASCGAGVGSEAFEHLLQGIDGQPWQTLTRTQSEAARLLASLGLDTSRVLTLGRHGLAILQAALARREPVFVTLDSPFTKDNPDIPEEDRVYYQLPHKVRALRIDADRVVYEDPLDPEEPWLPGIVTRVLDRQGHCAVGLDDFLAIITEMNLRRSFLEGFVAA